MGGVEAQAKSIRRGEVSAVEVVVRHVEAADRDNGSVNAFITRTAEAALDRAARIDQTKSAGGPLAGIPFTVKDNLQTEGVRTTSGSLLLEDHVPTRNAPVVDLMLRAGAVMVGKTSCPEFAMDIHTANRLIGATRNPLDSSRTSGGSSGGDSAAVAAGFSAFGVGTDYGASVRWPAQCTGLAALRPTIGRFSSDGFLPNASTHPSKPMNSVSVRRMAHTVGFIAPSARDLAFIMSAIGTFAHEHGDAPDLEIKDLNVAWFEGEGNATVRGDLVDVVSTAASLLETAGVRVEAGRPPGIEGSVETLRALRDADGLDDVMQLARGKEEMLSSPVLRWLQSARTTSVSEYQELAGTRDAIRAQGLEFMDEWPVWLLPVTTLPAFELDSSDPTASQAVFDNDGTRQERFELMAPCWAISAYGFPVAVVTLGESRESLPVAVQVVGRPGADRVVLEVAALLEQLTEEAK